MKSCERYKSSRLFICSHTPSAQYSGAPSQFPRMYKRLPQTHPNHRTMFPHHLPPELVLTIGTFLEAERDIYSLCQTNKQLYMLLIRYLYHINSRNSSRALIWSAIQGSERTARMSIEAGAEIGLTDRNGRGPLSWAARNGHEAVVRLLLDTGKVDVNSMDCGGRTPLYCAMASRHKEVVQLLLENDQVNVDLL